MHRVRLKCYLILGVPHTEATCSCGEKRMFNDMGARNGGFSSDYAAASAWSCPNDRGPHGNVAHDA